MGIQHLLKRLSFPCWIILATLSKNNWPYLQRLIFRLNYIPLICLYLDISIFMPIINILAVNILMILNVVSLGKNWLKALSLNISIYVFHFNGYKQPELFFSHLECLTELEPVLRTFEEITFLEAVIQLKKTKVNYHMKC